MINICEEEDKDKDFIWFCKDAGKESFIYFKNMTHKSRSCMAEHIIRESKKEREGCAQESIDEAKKQDVESRR